MHVLYDLIFFLAAVVYLPIYLFRKKFHRGFLSRLGFLPQDPSFKSPIWVHAVSVGEVMAVRGLIDGLRIDYPQKMVVISTVTPTGNRIAQDIAKDKDFVTYLPLDFSFIVKRVIDRIEPCLFIIAETEIWPNLISYLHKKNIPVIVVNGRISDHSFKGYLAVKFLISPILAKIDLFCVQTPCDKERLKILGVQEEIIKVAGNLKFDSAAIKPDAVESARFRRGLGIGWTDKVLICGSTHQGEEEIILGIYKDLLLTFDNLRLIIAPRHPERADEVEKLIEENGFQAIRISRLVEQERETQRDPKKIFILDTVGQLINYYAICDIVFVGGSLIKKGGHNILEPAFLEKPILFGPYMFNFRDIAELFLVNEAAISVADKAELRLKIKELLTDNNLAQLFGKRAKELILANIGSTEKVLDLVQNLIVRKRESVK